MDSRFVCKLEDDEAYRFTPDGIIIVHRERKPKYVRVAGDTVSIFEIEAADAEACGGKLIFGR